jgi:hypothetical protein
LVKIPGDVWSVAASNYHGQHRATMPVDLARRAIAAACPEQRCAVCRAPYERDAALTRRLALTAGQIAIQQATERPPVPLKPTCRCRASDGRLPATEAGLVLDPFLGSGTSAVAAEVLGRDWLGIELNQAYAAEATARIEAGRATRNNS